MKSVLAAICAAATCLAACAHTDPQVATAQAERTKLLEQCGAADRRYMALEREPEADSLPALNASRRCWAQYNAWSGVVYQHRERPDRQTAQRVQGLQAVGQGLQGAGQALEESRTRFPDPASMQPPTMLPPPPAVTFDPGYERRPTPTVTCVGQVMVSGPPDQASACAGGQ
jgi:hypothetical protein